MQNPAPRYCEGLYAESHPRQAAGWKQDAIATLLKTKQSILDERRSKRVWATLSTLGGVAAVAAWSVVWMLA